MDLREEFVLRAGSPGASIAGLSREYGISRKTAYKWLRRFRDRGAEGLSDLSRRPKRSLRRVSGEMVLQVLEARTSFPNWGPKKLRVVVARTKPKEAVPSVRTIARILERIGAPPIRKKRVRAILGSAPLHPPGIEVAGPNDLWTVDFKGWWRVRNGMRCDPLTVRDAFSRKILLTKIVRTTSVEVVQKHFKRLFQQYGMPSAIQVDNGIPFVSVLSHGGLTRLSAYWVALGIQLIRSRIASPQDNGAHERMHGDLEKEAVDRQAPDVRSQQGRLDAWALEFNSIRPHEALGMKTPDEVYRKSARRFTGIRSPVYPARFYCRKVAPTATVTFDCQTYMIGTAMCGYLVGIERVNENVINARLYRHELGLISPTRYQRRR